MRYSIAMSTTTKFELARKAYEQALTIQEQLVAEHPESAEYQSNLSATYNALGSFYLSQGLSTQVGHLYLATELRQGAAAPEGTEALSIARVPLEEAWARACRGELRDSVTLVGLAWARERLR